MTRESSWGVRDDVLPNTFLGFPKESLHPHMQQGGQISPVPSAHTRLMTYKMHGGDLAAGMNNVHNGILGIGLHGNGGNNGIMHNSSNGNGAMNGGNGIIGPGGTLGIVSGDYIDLNELLNMDANGGGHDDSLVA